MWGLPASSIVTGTVTGTSSRNAWKSFWRRFLYPDPLLLTVHGQGQVSESSELLDIRWSGVSPNHRAVMVRAKFPYSTSRYSLWIQQQIEFYLVEDCTSPISKVFYSHRLWCVRFLRLRTVREYLWGWPEFEFSTDKRLKVSHWHWSSVKQILESGFISESTQTRLVVPGRGIFIQADVWLY